MPFNSHCCLQAYTRRLPMVMQHLSALGLINRVLVAPASGSAKQAPPTTFVVHPTATLLVPSEGD